MTPAGTPLGVALGRLAEAAPARAAIIHDGVTVSRRELDESSNRLARAYAELGVTQDDLVTISLPNGVEFYEAVLATWKLGATPQPMSSRLPSAERAALIELADPALVVGVDPAEAGGRAAVQAGFRPAAELSADPLEPRVASSWKAPTSGGSAGRPKLILATSPSLLEHIAPFAALVGMAPEGTQLVTGPMYHNAPFMFSSIGLLTGCTQVVMTRFDALGSLRLVEEHVVDWMYAVPTMMNRIWRLPETDRTRPDLSSLRTLIHMAAPCPEWLKEAFIEWLGPERILELYAGTEAQAGTVIRGDAWLSHRGSVGQPVLGEISVLDADGSPAPAGEVGQVWMRRGQDAPPTYHYVGAEAKTREDGWESLGDLGYLDEDGYLYLTDRESDMILVGGANVYPAEVEAALEEHPAVESAAVVGRPDEDLGNVPHAFVLASGVDDEELYEHLRSRLAAYKLPRGITRVEEPLRDDAGKVRRSALRDRLLGATTT
jgi:bile acid-coenzyme A ligase